MISASVRPADRLLVRNSIISMLPLLRNALAPLGNGQAWQGPAELGPYCVCAAGRTPADTGRPGREVSNRSSPWWAEGMRQMMSKFMRFTSRGRHPSKFSSHSTSICFPVWALKLTVSWRGLQKDFVWLYAMPWNGNSKLHPSPARQKWQKGPLSFAGNPPIWGPG